MNNTILNSIADGSFICIDCSETIYSTHHICTADIIPPETIGIFKIKSIEIIEDNNE